MRAILALLLALPLALAGCAGPGAPAPGDPADDDGTNATPPAEAQVDCDDLAPLDAPDPAWAAQKPRVRLETSEGTLVAEIEREAAPIPANNFLNLTEQGFYDGVTFHRVIDGFVIQGGDPNSKDDDPNNDGLGGPGYEIPDQFNPALRHDAPGVLSMATAGPDTGGSQFFITLSPTPGLDDRHSVFGRVVEGMDVVERIGKVETDARDRPVQPVVVQDAEVVDPACFEPRHDVGVHAILDEKTTEPGRGATFAVVLKNEGNTRDRVTLAADAPEGWTTTVNEAPVIPAHTGRVVFVTLTPPAGAAGTHDVTLTATSAWDGAQPATDTVQVEVAPLGEAVQNGDRVMANYVGVLPDGRLFDTSLQHVAQDPEQPKFETQGGFQPRPSYAPFEFTVGSGVIPGFTNLAKTAKEGETVTGPIPWEQAYAQGDMYQRPLTKRDLVFELQIVEITS